MLSACAGRDFSALRDTVIVRLFLDTGMRLSELAGLTLDSIDFDHHVAIVIGNYPQRC